jgi:hypothetical protein
MVDTRHDCREAGARGSAAASLPDPFRRSDGSRIAAAADWPGRRSEILEQIVGLEYGGLPPRPERTEWVELSRSAVRWIDGASFITGQVRTGPDHPFGFMMQLLVPPGEGPFEVVLNGDGCWRTVTDEVSRDVIRRGRILAQFNRTEIVADNDGWRDTGLCRLFPEGTFGALAAWAWGYHRCVDALATLPEVDAARIAVVGHSRGGKTTLLAGATDERIALTAANNSGAGGAGCFRVQGPKSETLADLLRNFARWFGPAMPDYVGREADLPFDQHFLKALVAPRALLTTEGFGDVWANPVGTWQTHLAAREVYRFLDAPERIGIRYREGGHDHGLADWKTLIDFMDVQFGGQPVQACFSPDPFPGVPPAFRWRAPGVPPAP